MEILTSEQMRKADQYTIDHLPINSVDLMERAAQACFQWIQKNIGKESDLVIFCGRGNNGGDGLALTRLLYGAGYTVTAWLPDGESPLSSDCQLNRDRLTAIDPSLIKRFGSGDEFPAINKGTVIIDALFGTGLTRPAEGRWAATIHFINQQACPVVSIDLPSGIDSNKSSKEFENNIIKATNTLTFQYLKPALVVGENARFYGRVTVLDIGLLPEATQHLGVTWQATDRKKIAALYRPRKEFSHKGDYGHSLLIAGGKGKMGAALLAAGGYLRSGAGLLTVAVPEHGLTVIQTAVPEAMAVTWSDDPDPAAYSVTGIGPGIGTGADAVSLVNRILDRVVKPVVVDADALNILSGRKEWLKRVPGGSVLTPHPGEFRRLAGNWENDFEKLELQRQFAMSHNLFVILKGKNTSIASPDGTLWFNPTGNAGMAKGGSGDVLTGLVTGLIASGYSPFESCLLGTWLHGLAGDLAAHERTQEGMKAGDIIRFIPKAWQEVVAYAT